MQQKYETFWVELNVFGVFEYRLCIWKYKAAKNIKN